MSLYLGIDTSNYTTSVALYDSNSGQAVNSKKLLPVSQGAVGLRQGDAVFHHVQQLAQVFEDAVKQADGQICAVGVSTTPRPVEGSYMPCFSVGKMAAQIVASSLRIPLYELSHQCGHILAALYDTDNMDYLNRPFIAFHFSGGTSECLYAVPNEEKLVDIELEAGSLDLKAGQVIDRVGRMLDIPFPAGMKLDELSHKSKKKWKVRPTFKGADCCLSGIENQCKNLLDKGEKPEDIALFAVESIKVVCDKMAADACRRHPNTPIIFAGGVMSNSIISASLKNKYDCSFAAPALSSDNAVGAALFAYLKDSKK
ncbi:MAG: peptidase M22 [Oscillospiraceae bacterium]|nr:peptidase M22 [Oscillospiraceae bacterium]